MVRRRDNRRARLPNRSHRPASWSHAQRVAYANDLADTDHLAINASENDAKGADGPDQWRPRSRDSWRRYARVWDRIKAKWYLSVTRTEWAALVEMAATC
jgi:hypothetical protein